MADENDSQDFGDFLQRAIKPYSDAYRSLHETFKEYVPGYELLSAMEQKVIREASKMGKKKLLHPSLFNIPREKQDEFDLIDDEEFNTARDEFIRGKMSAMQRDDERGWSTD